MNKYPLLEKLNLITQINFNNFDDCTKPTERVCEYARELLTNLYEKTTVPNAGIYPDGEGGLRIEWNGINTDISSRKVRLIIHTTLSKSYIYHHDNDTYKTHGIVWGENDLKQSLVYWINWYKND